MQQWKQDVLKMDELKADVQGSLYDAAKLAVKVSDDPEWRAETKLTYEDAIDDWLSKHLSERFSELRSVLNVFPRRDQWTGKAFWQLKLEAAEQLRRERAMAKAKATDVTDRRTPTEVVVESPRVVERPESFLGQGVRQVPTAVLRNAVTQRDTAVRKVETLEEEVVRLRDENKRLHAELATANSLVNTLREENSDLRSRLTRPKVTHKTPAAFAGATG